MGSVPTTSRAAGLSPESGKATGVQTGGLSDLYPQRGCCSASLSQAGGPSRDMRPRKGWAVAREALSSRVRTQLRVKKTPSYDFLEMGSEAFVLTFVRSSVSDPWPSHPGAQEVGMAAPTDPRAPTQTQDPASPRTPSPCRKQALK